MNDIELTADEKKTLLKIAHESILYGLQNHKSLPVNAQGYSHNLQQNRATFVTLNLQQKLRGCIGTLDAHQPLICDVAEHAYAAAFEDPRFSPINEFELAQLEIHLSILAPAVPLHFISEEDLLRQLQPGIDGLTLQAGAHRGTFLPAVWEQLPQPKQFVRHLKMKAGLAENYWSNNLKISRYTTTTIPDKIRTHHR